MSDDVVGRRAYRLIPSRFPVIRLYENHLDPSELELAFQLEALTNERLRDLAGDIAHVPPEERVTGPGCSVIMAAFTHIGAQSRFSAGDYGVFYAGLDVGTAIEESRCGQVRFLSATAEPPFEVTMRSYVTQVALPLTDIRAPEFDRYHQPDDWPTAQSFGRQARAGGAAGLWYRSVRNAGGECVAAFRTVAVRPVTQAAHYRFLWDGQTISAVYELRGIG